MSYALAMDVRNETSKARLAPWSSRPSAELSKESIAWWSVVLIAYIVYLIGAGNGYAAPNLLTNPGFEEPLSSGHPPGWTARNEAAVHLSLSDSGTHSGRQCLALPAHTVVEQRVNDLPGGAYLARCWIKSEIEQAITLLLQDPDEPWMGYTCAELKVPKGQWIQLETFCVLNTNGALMLTLGGVSREFRNYHGAGAEMAAPILVDDCELLLYKPNLTAGISVWDADKPMGSPLDALAPNQWTRVEGLAHAFQGSAVFQDQQLTGVVRPDGALVVYSAVGKGMKLRGVVTPAQALGQVQCSLIRTNDRAGIRVAASSGNVSYTAWLGAAGVIHIEPHQIAQFRLSDCQLRYGILPSFVGSDLCYSPAKFSALSKLDIPSTQWFVGLVNGNESMLVTVWGSQSQRVSLGLSGGATNRIFDAFSIETAREGFSFSFVEHTNVWHEQRLEEDWLGEYVPIPWKRPFPARWMGQFLVTPGARATFREPNMSYSFPVANAKTRLWGVWFEDWNYFPFYFDGATSVFHFEKSFIPNGNALVYFLEPAAAELYSPCEIVEQVLGAEGAARLFDFSANRIRKLHYSTPDEFMYDRPVCATTTRLSKISQQDKATVGLNLATHLYEFIREIRARVDEYKTGFENLNAYLNAEKATHPEARQYIDSLEIQVTEALTKSSEIYATPLSEVEKKTESMKTMLLQGKSDGFDCGSLDVRGPAGAQDDLCRRYNRLMLKLVQTAALNAGDSEENVKIAQHLWDESRKILRRPTRWEPRRTLYFFEP